MDLFEKCNKDLAKEIIAKNLYPYFHTLESRQGAEVIMEGKRKIMLGSNNYLGLTTHQKVIQAGLDALNKYGSGCSGSRFLNGTLDLHLELEKELADFLEKESALTFGTGFQSNLGIISAITGRGDFILNDRENHASIYDACKLSYATTLRYKHNDMEDLEAQLLKIPLNASILIVTDGVFSMSGDICKLPDIVYLAAKYGARVMVDDAHGMGILGKDGRGTADHFGLTNRVDIIMGTFSKSLASLGGYMVADKKVVDYIRHTSRPFIFSASMTPANCNCALAALKVLKENPTLVTHLNELSAYLRDGLLARGIKIKHSSTPIVPIYTYDFYDTLWYGKKLYEEGVYVNPVLPPATPPDECLLRLSLMATHTKELLDEAMDTIDKVLKEGPKYE